MAKILIPFLAVLCLWPQVPAALALVAGLLVALSAGNPYPQQTRKLTPQLLQWSVVGLGAGMNLNHVLQTGAAGLAYTLISIVFVVVAGFLVMRAFRVERDAGVLITV